MVSPPHHLREDLRIWIKSRTSSLGLGFLALWPLRLTLLSTLMLWLSSQEINMFVFWCSFSMSVALIAWCVGKWFYNSPIECTWSTFWVIGFNLLIVVLLHLHGALLHGKCPLFTLFLHVNLRLANG